MTLADWIREQRMAAERALLKAQIENTPTAATWERHWAEEQMGWELLRLGLAITHPACLACDVWEDPS